MSLEPLTETQLSDCTLRALVNSLHMHGHDLDKILTEYDNEILDNRLSGAAPQHKLASIDHLKSIIAEARANKELNK
ncbi:hypothetical protein SOI71_05575 [Acinetobacter pittii]|uniref:hypothetical protein n=1 Tax=Acinetobacter pittii TaxID=48296 RepID=UPI000CE33A2E|nr:hypothetical protein [Acinetobacter pittii]PPC02533.1 hypothetical protein ApiMCR53_06020 [Acinetobacter pittii]WPP78305.1 hypothetical protein SOI71_05575 [Acinetobacter pittii]